MIVNLPQQPSACGAVPAPEQGNRQAEPMQAFADACNALSMAAYYLRQSPCSNVPAAMRKTGLALAALRRLNAALAQGGAA